MLTNSEVRLPFATVRVGPDLSPVTLYATRRSQKGKTAEPHEFWTTFQLIADNFGALADGWIRKAEDLGAAFHLYTATRRGEHLFTEHKFVNLIWGLEALQRRVGPVVDNQRSETKISGMLDRIENAADQKCLRKLLKRAADPALKDRLAAILGRLKLPVDQKALRRFAQRCAEARNDISHLGGPRHGTSYTAFVVELHKFAQALDPLYHALILQEIGMSLDLLHQVLLSGRQSMWVRDALREVGLDIPHTPNFAPTI